MNNLKIVITMWYSWFWNLWTKSLLLNTNTRWDPNEAYFDLKLFNAPSRVHKGYLLEWLPWQCWSDLNGHFYCGSCSIENVFEWPFFFVGHVPWVEWQCWSIKNGNGRVELGWRGQWCVMKVKDHPLAHRCLQRSIRWTLKTKIEP